MQFARLRHIREFIHKFDHVLLLISLIITLALPLISALLGLTIYNVRIVTLISIIAGISVVYTNDARRLRYFMWYGNIIGIATFLDLLLRFPKTLEGILIISQVIFFFALTTVLLQFILKLKRVSGQMVVNAISGYLLLGVCWSIIVGLWTLYEPTAYNFDVRAGGLYNETYYAFVTMTTLGYGDMLPQTEAAKALAVFISITGAFYTTLVMGIIVGKYISSEQQKSTN